MTAKEIREISKSKGIGPVSNQVSCSECKTPIAYWITFDRKHKPLFQPTKSHTQIVCGIHPDCARNRRELHFEIVLIFGFECHGFNLLNELVKLHIPEITKLGEKTLHEDSPYPQPNKGCFITAKEILMLSGGDFSVNRWFRLQTEHERFLNILDFLKTPRP